MKILLALDDNVHDEIAIQAVSEKIQTANSAVKVMTAVSIDYQSEIDIILRNSLRGAAEAKLTAAASKLRSFAGADLRVACEVVEGDAATAILDAAERWDADLIVISSHKRRGLKQFLFGSVSQTVARAANCSVLVVPADPAATHPMMMIDDSYVH